MRCASVGGAGGCQPGQYGVDAAEQPRVAQRAAADHDAVAAGLFNGLLRALGGCDIPVRKHRDAHGLFDGRHGVPVNRRGCTSVPACGRERRAGPRRFARTGGPPPARSGARHPSRCRILTVSGVSSPSACRAARTIAPHSAGSSISLLPAPPPVILGAGQPMLRSSISNRISRSRKNRDSLPEQVRLAAEQLHGVQPVGVAVPQQGQALFIAKGDGLGAGHLADLSRPRRGPPSGGGRPRR